MAIKSLFSDQSSLYQKSVHGLLAIEDTIMIQMVVLNHLLIVFGIILEVCEKPRHYDHNKCYLRGLKLNQLEVIFHY